jgi:hypothetical protein
MRALMTITVLLALSAGAWAEEPTFHSDSESGTDSIVTASR